MRLPHSGSVIICLFALTMLTGCIGLAVQGGEAVVDRSTIAIEEPAAIAGDPAAQYKMGDAYCCSARGERGLLLKNNQTATLWLCKSARQDYAKAKLRLARIYSGDRITGLALMERMIGVADTPKAAKPEAFLWARLASADPDREIASDADRLAEKLDSSMSPEEHQRANNLLGQDWHVAPCEWRDVFRAS